MVGAARRSQGLRTLHIGVVGVAAGVGVISGTVGGDRVVAAPAVQTVESAVSEAHDAVNMLRELSGLAPVALDPALSAPAGDHACWMVNNDIISHSEIPGSPGYTAAGADSAGRSNVAVSSSTSATAQSFVSLWMTGPYHAVAIVDPRLTSVGYGQCADDSGTWRSAGTLDILGGLGAGQVDRVVTFPGNGAAVPWHTFITESPNPLANCSTNGAQWTTAGVPLFALLPESPAPGATATLTGPGGVPLELCVITEHNDVSPTGSSILSSRQAMVAVPHEALADGHYEVTFDTGHRVVRWGFDVDAGAAGPYRKLETAESAPAPTVTGLAAAATYVPDGPTRTFDSRLGAGRLDGGREYHIPVGDAPAGATAVVVNVTTTQTDASGWVSVHPCGQFAGTSTSNFAAGRTGSTTTIVQLGGSGVCARTEGAAHLVADVAGWMVAGEDGAGFVAGERRAFDTRTSGAQLEPTRAVRVGVAEPGTVAVAMNLTTTGAADAGFVTVWPCASADEPAPTVSLGQSRPESDQAAFGIVPVAPDGAVCLSTSARTHVVVDVAGTFVDGAGSRYVAFPPVRRFDTRLAAAWASPGAPGMRLGPDADGVGMHLAVPGMPEHVDGVVANVTVTSTAASGWMGVKPCGDAADTSDVNFGAGDTIANMTVIPTTPAGEACAVLSTATHVVMDLSGVFVP